MKLKILPVILASFALISCGTNKESTSTPASEPAASEESQTSEVKIWEYIDFISGEKNARIDIFDFEEGLQVSYGNTALVNGTNNVELNANSLLSVNKNLDHEKSFYTLIAAETNLNGHHEVYKKVYLATEGDHLTDLFDIIKDAISSYQRAYVAFTVGTQAKWTRNLNTKLDEFFEAATTPIAD